MRIHKFKVYTKLGDKVLNSQKVIFDLANEHFEDLITTFDEFSGLSIKENLALDGVTNDPNGDFVYNFVVAR